MCRKHRRVTREQMFQLVNRYITMGHDNDQDDPLGSVGPAYVVLFDLSTLVGTPMNKLHPAVRERAGFNSPPPGQRQSRRPPPEGGA